MFKVTQHQLSEAQMITPERCDAVAAEMNEIRKTHLLYDCSIVADGAGMVCVWVEIDYNPGSSMPLGFRLV